MRFEPFLVHVNAEAGRRWDGQVAILLYREISDHLVLEPGRDAALLDFIYLGWLPDSKA